MITLNENNMSEILANTNHETVESIEHCLYVGEIEVFENRKDYLKAGYTFENDDYYLMLNDGKVVYFIGG